MSAQTLVESPRRLGIPDHRLPRYVPDIRQRAELVGSSRHTGEQHERNLALSIPAAAAHADDVFSEIRMVHAEQG